MPFDKELTHLIEQQISARAGGGVGGVEDYVRTRQSAADSRIEALEANIQRLAEEFAKFLNAQKKGQKNEVEYGLEVIALHDFRLAVTGGRAYFFELNEPVDLPYTYLQISPAGNERQIRYIYLQKNGIILESTTDPSNMGSDYLPLAMIDVWANATEITQDRIKDIRPSSTADANTSAGTSNSQSQLVGNVTLSSPDTGNDSFIISATVPASLKINVSAGRALVDGEIIDAPGGVLDLTGHLAVPKEFLGFGDGSKKTFTLYHKNITNLVACIDAVEQAVTVDTAAGTVSFAAAPGKGAAVTASYCFSGDYMLIILVEKVMAADGHTFGVIGFKAGNNRTPDQPPDLPAYQHAIAKVDMSSALNAITDYLIDNSYEVKNLNQFDLQYGGYLGEDSLQDGAVSGVKIAVDTITGVHIMDDAIAAEKIMANAITSDKIMANAITGDKIMANVITSDKIMANAIIGDKIMANTITGDKIIAGGIDTANIKAGAITADRIASGAITADKIAANSISAAMIRGGVITADKFESATWGDISQALRFVKAILGGTQNWKKSLTENDLTIGVKGQVAVNTGSYPSLRLDTERHWDSGTWDAGNWDLPVYTSGYWESASFDYGLIDDLQAEFWAKPIIDDPAVAITVKAKYSDNNVTFTDYEILDKHTAVGYYYWIGTLQSFRHFKIRVEFTTTDVNKYTVLGFPEVHVANCQIGTEDISDYAITQDKIANGSVTNEKLAPGIMANHISILTGTVRHGVTIPLPAGYMREQCKWLVSPEKYWSATVQEIDNFYCYTDGNGVVTALTENRDVGDTVNYIIIGVR